MWNEIRSTPTRKSSAKLAELRLKTDRDLKALLEKALDRVSQLLRHGDKEQAESTYSQAAALLPLVRALSARERQPLERRIGALRTELDRGDSWRRIAS